MTRKTYSSKIRLSGLTVGLLFAIAACGKPEQQQGFMPQAIPVDTTELVADKIRESSQYLGRVEANERVTLASRVDGRVTQILVKEGDRVAKGQPILQLQQTREKAEVNAAVSQVNIAKADLVNAQTQVKAAEAEVARAEAEVKQAQADLRSQEAEVALARTNIERAKFLVKEGAESQQFLDDSTKELESAIAEKEALQQALNASNKSLIAAREGVTAAIASVDGQKASLDRAKASVEVASENLQFNRLTAPIDGIVGNITPKAGDYLEAGNNITTITSNDSLAVNIGIPIEQAERLKLGLPVMVIDRGDRAEPIMGKISFISPTTTQQTILVKATLPDNKILQDEQSVSTRVIWQEKPGVLIPTTAISRIAGQSFVFVAEEAEQEQSGETSLIAKQKVVQLGDIQGQTYQVISGLEPGDKLITSGILNLTDGAPISYKQEVSTIEP